MKALLLAAGLGTRLRPLTDSIPKCLVPIKEQALLDIWLQNLTQGGIGPFLINTHYHAIQVENYVKSSLYRNQVTLVNEPELLGTAGTLIDNLDFFEGRDGLLIHADNYCRPDFMEFIRAHEKRPADCVMTMMTFRTESPSSCGIVELDDRGVVVGFHEKVAAPPGNLANGAIYILSGELLKCLAIEFQGATDFSTEVLPQLVGKILTYETNGPFVDIGTPESYRRVCAAN
jgi:mannose-1-phosphate guanylyltransferase